MHYLQLAYTIHVHMSDRKYFFTLTPSGSFNWYNTDSWAVVVCSVFSSLLATNDCMPPVGLKVATSCVNYEQQMHTSYPPVVCGNPQLTQVCAQIFVFLITYPFQSSAAGGKWISYTEET